MIYFLQTDSAEALNDKIGELIKVNKLDEAVYYDKDDLELTDVLGGLFNELEDNQLVVFKNVDKWKNSKANWIFLKDSLPEQHLLLVSKKAFPAASKKIKASTEVIKNPSKKPEITKFLNELLNKKDLSLSAESKKYLLSHIGDPKYLPKELDKLKTYSLTNDLTDDVVVELINPTSQSNYFLFLDSLVLGKTKTMQAELDKLLLAGDSPVSLTVRLLNYYNNLIQIKAGTTTTNIAPFILSKNRDQIRSLPKNHQYWTLLREGLTKLDQEVRSGLFDGEEVLRIWTIRLSELTNKMK